MGLGMSPRSLRMLAPLVAVLALAGCLGAAVGPGVPAADLNDHGWQPVTSEAQTLFGLLEISRNEYAPRAGSDAAGVLVVAVTDVPFLDEASRVPEQIDAYAARNGLTFTPVGSLDLALPNRGITVPATEYDVEGAPVPARALVATFSCDEPDVLVVTVGYGALPTGAGPFGTADLYGDAKEVAAAAACSV